MTNEKTPLDCDVPDIGGGSLAGELARFVRYTTAAIGGYLVAEGIASQATVELVAGIVTTATPLLVGMALARVRRRHVADVISSLKASKDNKSEGE